MKRCCWLYCFLFLLVMNAVSTAAVFVRDTGEWPKDWPAELEPLRAMSRTVGVATGIQQDIYEIPLADRATFDKIWPAILKLRTPESPITLSRVNAPPPPHWGELLNNAQAAIRIYAPTGGIVTLETTDPQQQVDYAKLLTEGRALRAGPPWPDDLPGAQGELPEYVIAIKNDEGHLVWAPADPFAKDQPHRGFFQRARVEIELVVDGQTVDLNQIPLPGDAKIIDHRFPKLP